MGNYSDQRLKALSRSKEGKGQKQGRNVVCFAERQLQREVEKSQGSLSYLIIPYVSKYEQDWNPGPAQKPPRTS